MTGTNDTDVTLSGLTPEVRTGQSITLAYTDPTPNTDDTAAALQDAAGNDAAGFTTGLGTAPAVTNGSTIDPEAPDVPKNLRAAGGGTDRIVLTWDAPAYNGGAAITSYRIEVSEDGTTFTSLVPAHVEMENGAILRRYVHTPLNVGDVRHYRVSATNSEGTGDASAVARGITVAPGTLKEPTGLAAEAVGGTEIRLTWTAPVDTGDSAITGYRIEWSADGNDPWAALAADIGNTDRRYSDTGLASESNGSTRPVVVPGAPLQVRAAGGGADRIVVTREAPSYNGGAAIASYRIEVSADGNDPWTVEQAAHDEMQNGAILSRYVHDELEAGDERHYRVSATNSVGTGPISATASGRALAPGVAGPPRDLEATPGLPATPDGTTQIGLAWGAPASTGDSAITGYRIEWSANGNDPWTELVADTGSPGRTWSDTGLASETTRHYRVSAINGQGTGLPSASDDATTADIIPPVLEYAIVHNGGARIELNFDAAIDSAASGLPPKGAFTVTIDGAETGFGTVSAGTGNTDFIYLNGFAPTIKSGQAVRITWTDPTDAADTAAIQDLAGNDAATFTTGEAGVPAASNNSAQAPVAPDPPASLRAEPGGEDRIVLTWDAPAYNGGAAIASYRIERSADGSDPWMELVANHAVMKDGAILRRYEHTGLMAGDERHYRVSATNSVDTGDRSEVAHATTTVPGTVDLALASASVAEGGAAAWTVTATSAEDERPEAGFAMEVRLRSADVSAETDVDYAALDTTLRFVRADFTRKDIGGNDYRWVAEKSGTVDVTDDVEVEAEERFALEAAIVTSGVPFAVGTGQLEVSIPNTDSWGVEVTAAPAEITEGETRAVTLTARVTPGEPGEGCVAAFPVTLGLMVGGGADDPADYTLDAAPAEMRLAPCEAEASWQVTLAAKLETVPDADETVSAAVRFSPTSPTQREFCRFSLFSTTQVIELLESCTPNSPQYRL